MATLPLPDFTLPPDTVLPTAMLLPVPGTAGLFQETVPLDGVRRNSRNIPDTCDHRVDHVGELVQLLLYGPRAVDYCFGALVELGTSCPSVGRSPDRLIKTGSLVCHPAHRCASKLFEYVLRNGKVGLALFRELNKQHSVITVPTEPDIDD